MYHDTADSLTVLQCVLAGQEDFPHAVADCLQRMASAVPEVKITGQIHGLCSRCPFPVIPAIIGTVKTVKHVAVCEFLQGLAVLQNALSGVFQIVHTRFQIAPEGCQTLIIVNDFQIHNDCPFNR